MFLCGSSDFKMEGTSLYMMTQPSNNSQEMLQIWESNSGEK